MTKDELRAELERQEQRVKDLYGGEVTTYAAKPEPGRKPWRKRASLLDQAFTQEIQKIEKELKAEMGPVGAEGSVAIPDLVKDKASYLGYLTVDNNGTSGKCFESFFQCA